MARKSPTSNSLNTAAKILGAKGGKAGGPARARALTPQQRSEIARKGANATNAIKKTGKSSGK